MAAGGLEILNEWTPICLYLNFLPITCKQKPPETRVHSGIEALWGNWKKPAWKGIFGISIYADCPCGWLSPHDAKLVWSNFLPCPLHALLPVWKELALTLGGGQTLPSNRRVYLYLNLLQWRICFCHLPICFTYILFLPYFVCVFSWFFCGVHLDSFLFLLFCVIFSYFKVVTFNN